MPTAIEFILVYKIRSDTCARFVRQDRGIYNIMIFNGFIEIRASNSQTESQTKYGWRFRRKLDVAALHQFAPTRTKEQHRFQKRFFR
ncbi:MAG TPA: hypothetical protein DE015_04250 [Oceanospirillales bacterium]|nr:hypothetical protein [Oceanospirillales bacterium]